MGLGLQEYSTSITGSNNILEAEDFVTSEVHREQPLASKEGCLSHSTYNFRAPQASSTQSAYIESLHTLFGRAKQCLALNNDTIVLSDTDGDLDPPRKLRLSTAPGAAMAFPHISPSSGLARFLKYSLSLLSSQSCHSGPQAGSLVIRHQTHTAVNDVGLQVWKGAFLLGDLALSLGPKLSGLACLELGSGTGLTGICLSIVCRDVWLTDTGHDLLVNCEANVRSNAPVHTTCRTHVRQLHWGQPLPVLEGAQNARHSWSAEDLAKLAEVQTYWAADVVYDADSTDMFLQTACQLLANSQASGSQPVLFTSMEKRVNFAFGDSTPRAHAHEHFLEKTEGMLWQDEGQIYRLVAQELEVDLVPQWFEYQRGKDLALFRLHLEMYLEVQ